MFQVFEVEYMSYEGNFRRSDIVLESEHEISDERAMSEYRSNTGCMGDDACDMISAHCVATFDSRAETEEYCRRNDVFSEIHTLDY